MTVAVAACVAAAGPLVGCGAPGQHLAITPANQATPLGDTVEEVALGGPVDIAEPEATAGQDPGTADNLPPGADLSRNARIHDITRETPFSMFALTWKGRGTVEAQVRAKLPDGTWSEWYELGALSTDSNSPDFDPAKRGSDPIFVGTTTAVQVLIDGEGEAVRTAQAEAASEAATTEDPAAPGGPADIARPMIQQPPAPQYDEEPEDVRAVLIRPSTAPIQTEPADATAPAPTDIATPVRPRVISRAQWGANEDLRCMEPSYSDGLGGVTIHHTAGNNNYTAQESAQIVRGIYAYHAQTLGWCDIGYHALVDKYGQIFEGRFGGLDKDVDGAHAGGFNENTAGYSMIGDYNTVEPPQAMIDAIGNLVGWRTMVGKLDPLGTSTHYSEGTQFTWVPQDGSIQLPNIFAHRDVGYTECPGDLAYQRMGEIRQIAAAYHKTYGGGATDVVPVAEVPTVANPAAAQVDPAPVDPAPVADASENEGDPARVQAAAEAPAAEVPAAAPAAETPAPQSAESEVDAIMPRLVGMLRGSLTDGYSPEIARRWVALGGGAGPLGGIVNGVTAGAGGVQYATFDNGAIYWSAETGAQAVWGAIRDTWAAQGAESSELGLPTSAEYEVEGGIRVDFQRGTLTFVTATGEVVAAPAPAPVESAPAAP